MLLSTHPVIVLLGTVDTHLIVCRKQTRLCVKQISKLSMRKILPPEKLKSLMKMQTVRLQLDNIERMQLQLQSQLYR